MLSSARSVLCSSNVGNQYSTSLSSSPHAKGVGVATNGWVILASEFKTRRQHDDATQVRSNTNRRQRRAATESESQAGEVRASDRIGALWLWSAVLVSGTDRSDRTEPIGGRRFGKRVCPISVQYFRLLPASQPASEFLEWTCNVPADTVRTMCECVSLHLYLHLRTTHKMAAQIDDCPECLPVCVCSYEIDILIWFLRLIPRVVCTYSIRAANNSGVAISTSSFFNFNARVS